MAFLDTNTPSLQNKPTPAPLKHLQGVKVLDLHFSTDISVKNNRQTHLHDKNHCFFFFFEVHTNDYRAAKTKKKKRKTNNHF